MDARDTGREFGAFCEALDGTPPEAITACRGWTAHEIVAHLASGADSFTAQLEAYGDGRPIPAFAAEQPREAPYREMDDAELRRRLVRSTQRMDTAVRAVLDAEPAAVHPDLAWGIPVADLVPHMRQEFALHRWDLIGDDDVGLALMGEPELLAHSVRHLAPQLLRAGLARDTSPSSPLRVILRCANSPDLVIDVHAGMGTLSLRQPADSGAVIETDPAARLLLVWGRRPADARRMTSQLTVDDLSRVQTLLSGW